MPVEVQVNDQASASTPDAGGALAARVERAARAVLRDRGVPDGSLSLTLLDDPGMAAMNRRWKEREGPTDVLAFTLHGPGEPVMGDIYLGVDRARAQAAELDEPFERELARLAIHGTLHVLGWDHPEEKREESEMWAHQERILAGVGEA